MARGRKPKAATATVATVQQPPIDVIDLAARLFVATDSVGKNNGRTANHIARLCLESAEVFCCEARAYLQAKNAERAVKEEQGAQEAQGARVDGRSNRDGDLMTPGVDDTDEPNDSEESPLPEPELAAVEG